jgi:ADP-ribosyl-[dinitrogen reductase] hydrolase
LVETQVAEKTELVKETTEKMRERFIGTLLGAAVGDALGGPIEFMTAQEIANRHGTVREMIGGGSYNWQRGEYTDDTSMMLCIAESLVDRQKYHPEDIAQRFTAWYKSNPKNIGGTTREALTKLCSGVSFCESGIKEKPTNGSVMRCAPLSLIYYHDEEALIKASKEVSAITHSHAEAELSCIFINVMIARLLMGANKKEAYNHAVARVQELDKDFVKRYIGSSYNPEPRKGLAVNTLLLATGSFLAARSFEETVVHAVNLGGDADTTGAVAGALAGAYFGRPGIPRRWSTRLNPKPANHFVWLGKKLFNMEPEYEKNHQEMSA